MFSTRVEIPLLPRIHEPSSNLHLTFYYEVRDSDFAFGRVDLKLSYTNDNSLRVVRTTKPSLRAVVVAEGKRSSR